jgi:transcriptional regulator with XRE-family HTH domain
MKLKNKKQYAELRKQIGTQDKVSNDLGIDRCTLSRRENGKQPLTNEACLALVGLYYLTTNKNKTV